MLGISAFLRYSYCKVEWRPYRYPGSSLHRHVSLLLPGLQSAISQAKARAVGVPTSRVSTMISLPAREAALGIQKLFPALPAAIDNPNGL
jgi:hypothetical protein